ncbi:unnamed protein product, partial [Amoebophrya sp. A25]
LLQKGYIRSAVGYGGWLATVFLLVWTGILLFLSVLWRLSSQKFAWFLSSLWWLDPCRIHDVNTGECQTDPEVKLNFQFIFIILWVAFFALVSVYVRYRLEFFNYCMQEVPLQEATYVAIEEQIWELPMAGDSRKSSADETARRSTAPDSEGEGGAAGDEEQEQDNKRSAPNSSTSTINTHDIQAEFSPHDVKPKKQMVSRRVLEQCNVKHLGTDEKYIYFQLTRLLLADATPLLEEQYRGRNPHKVVAFQMPHNDVLESSLTDVVASGQYREKVGSGSSTSTSRGGLSSDVVKMDRALRGANVIDIKVPAFGWWFVKEAVLVVNIWQIMRNIAVAFDQTVAMVSIPVSLMVVQLLLMARSKRNAMVQIEEAAAIEPLRLRVYRRGTPEGEISMDRLRDETKLDLDKQRGKMKWNTNVLAAPLRDSIVPENSDTRASASTRGPTAAPAAADGRSTRRQLRDQNLREAGVGNWHWVNSTQIVPGDIFEVPDGVGMPCDAILLEGYALMNEADLTGEPMPVSKFPIEPSENKLNLAKHGKKHYLYCGTSVLQSVGGGEEEEGEGGRGTPRRTTIRAYADDPSPDSNPLKAVGLAVQTGTGTTKGEMIRRILFPSPVRYKFSEQFNTFLFTVAALYILIYAIPQIIQAMRDKNGQNIFFTAMVRMFYEGVSTAYLIVAPTLLLCLMIAQNSAAERMFMSPARIKTLEPARLLMAGEVKVQCLDKTGTITEDGLDLSGTMPVQQGANGSLQLGELARIDAGPEGKISAPTRENLFSVAMSTCHTVNKGPAGELHGNLVEAEMVRKTLGAGMNFNRNNSDNSVDYFFSRHAASGTGGDQGALSGEEQRATNAADVPVYDASDVLFRTIRQFEFDQQVQLQSVVVDLLNGRTALITKGSYDSVSKIVQPETLPENSAPTLKALAMEGYYVLAFGYRDLSSRAEAMQAPRESLEQQENFLGFVLFRNEMKVDSVAAIMELKHGGVEPVMVTGDNIWTGIHVAESAGLMPRSALLLAADVETVFTAKKSLAAAGASNTTGGPPGAIQGSTSYPREIVWQYIREEDAKYVPAWVDLLTSSGAPGSEGCTDYGASLRFFGTSATSTGASSASPSGSPGGRRRTNSADNNRAVAASFRSLGGETAASAASNRLDEQTKRLVEVPLRLGPTQNFEPRFRPASRPLLQFRDARRDNACEADQEWIETSMQGKRVLQLLPPGTLRGGPAAR